MKTIQSRFYEFQILSFECETKRIQYKLSLRSFESVSSTWQDGINRSTLIFARTTKSKRCDLRIKNFYKFENLNIIITSHLEEKRHPASCNYLKKEKKTFEKNKNKKRKWNLKRRSERTLIGLNGFLKVGRFFGEGTFFEHRLEGSTYETPSCSACHFFFFLRRSEEWGSNELMPDRSARTRSRWPIGQGASPKLGN